jgi:hypothetical protein
MRSVLHLSPNRQTALANDVPTEESAPNWKALHAIAIGIPEDKAEDMSDEDQLKAHGIHMSAVEALSAVSGQKNHAGDANNFPAVDAGSKMIDSIVKTGMPPGCNSVEGRRAAAQLLMNEAMSRGSTYDEAFRLVHAAHPHLMPEKPENTPLSNSRENRRVDQSYLNRAAEVQALVKKQTSVGIDYDSAFSSVRRTRPDLFR